MRKLVLLGFFLIIMSALALAAEERVVANAVDAETRGVMQENATVKSQNAAEIRPVAVALNQKTRLKAGNYIAETGQQVQVQEEENSRIRLKVQNVSADTNLELLQERVQNRTHLRVNLSNGRLADIKVMPDTASERALERLRLRVCSADNNCTIQLREVGSVNQTRAAYNVEAQQQVRILGFIKARMRVNAEVDAETGEVIQSSRPWWAFLVLQ